jgi:hypothetical protein
MNMLPLLVIAAAIIAFFQDELASFLRKLFSYGWVRLFLPLLLVSVGVQCYVKKYFILQLTQARIHALMLSFFKLFPYGFGSLILSQSLFLFLVSALPVWTVFFWFKRKEVENAEFKVTCAYFFFWLSLILLWVV